MSKYLEKAKELRAIVHPHYNCTQSVLLPFAKEAGLDDETAMKVASNFGGGMRTASTCGAFTGGLMVLGLLGVEDPKAVVEFTNKMKANHDGTLECAALLKKNKEMGGDKKTHCDEMVYEAIELVEAIIKKYN